MITYEERQQAIDEFAKTRGSTSLVLVYHKPDRNARPTHCIQNVLSRIDQQGGIIKYGWTFHHRVNPEFGDYMFATHHAIWYNPEGSLDDITPFHAEKKHQPITEQGSVLFLLDESVQPLKVGPALIPLPLMYFPVRKEPAILKYIESLTQQESEHYRTNYGIDISTI